METATPVRPSSESTENGQQWHVFLFGDLTLSFERDLTQLLHVKDCASVQSFFTLAAARLRNECASLPSAQQERLPRFTTLIDLVANLDGAVDAPAMRFALMVLYQLGRFILHFSEGSIQYPRTGDGCVVGLCTGSFAAAAVACSRSIAELIWAGLDAVVIAFRTGLKSLEVRRNLAFTTAGAESWSAIVSLSEAVTDTIAAQDDRNPLARLYISAIAPHSITLSGPPAMLEEWRGLSPQRFCPLPIHAPYHAAHLYTSADTDEVLQGQAESELQNRLLSLPVLSPASGEFTAVASFGDLLRVCVHEVLREQVRWDRILPSLKKYCSLKALDRCVVLPVASNAAPLVSNKLKEIDNLGPSLDTSLYVPVRDSAKPTGCFEDSKIAITGFSGRFPEAASNDEFWELLRSKRDVHRTIPSDRFDWETHFDATGKARNTSKVKYGCFINDPGHFDARFFNLSPREAENADPAQRLALMCTYEALEMAGFVPNQSPSSQQDRVGVFMGVTSDDWREVNSGQNIDTYFIPGGNRAFVPGRISYFFKFSGPSMSIDTACSSSFASIQTACTYLWRGDCDTAVAGGTNVLTNPDNFAGLDRGHFLSTEGNCNAFDDGASGYCRADAVGTVILKRLDDALAEGDPIFGVIAGSNTNHCGGAESITRPFEGDQISVFKRVMRQCNTSPSEVGYVEMHGTGTQAGDATEMRSVLSVFAPDQRRSNDRPLYLGAVKANVGHAESASGVTSLIKVLLMMQRDEIPPHCGIKTKINRNYPLDLAERNVHIPMEPTPWLRADAYGMKRRAFLNNFSAAGGNTAILLEDAPMRPSADASIDARTVHMITVSAKTVSSLKRNVTALLTFLGSSPDISIAALSYTTTARRQHHKYRAAFRASNIDDLVKAMGRWNDDVELEPVSPTNKKVNVAFVFTGQGTLYSNLGRELFDSIPSFREDVQCFSRIARQQGFSDFLPIIDGTCQDIENATTVAIHLALGSVQMALCNLWRRWGVQPTLAVGHSLGEYAALYAAEVLTASDTIYLLGERSTLLSECCTRGSHCMLAVKAPVDIVKSHLGELQCDIACMNSPTSTVVGGTRADIFGLAASLDSAGLESSMLDIPYAFHSAQVDPILERFASAAENARFNAPSIPYLSPLLGEAVKEAGTLDAAYLAKACRGTVNFRDAVAVGVDLEIANSHTIWLEIGSHPTCSGMIKSTIGSQTKTAATLRKGIDSWNVLSGTLEELYLGGVDLKWNDYHRDFPMSHKIVQLPRYSWDVANHWIQYQNNFCLTKGSGEVSQNDDVSLPSRVSGLYISPSVQCVLEEKQDASTGRLLIESNIKDSRLAPIIQGHIVNTVPLCPSSLYPDMALTMVRHMLRKANIETEQLGIDCSSMKVENPLIASPSDEPQYLQALACADWSANKVSLTFFSSDTSSQKKTQHATCVLQLCPKQNWMSDWSKNAYLINARVMSLHQSVDEGNSHKLKQGLVYKLFGALVEYGRQYRGMEEVVLDSSDLEATATVRFQTPDEGFHFNPCWIDSLGHIAGFIMNGNDNVHSKSKVFINHGWDHMRCARSLEFGKTYITYNRMQLCSNDLYMGDTYILEGGEIVAIFEGIKFQGVPRKTLDRLLPLGSGARNSIPAASKDFGSTKSSSNAGRPPLLVSSDLATSHTTNKPSELMRDKVEGSSPGGKTDQRSRMIEMLAQEACLDVKDLDLDTEFADLGIDSLLSLTIAERLQRELEVNITSSAFEQYPTLGKLCEHILGRSDEPEVGTISRSSTKSSGMITPGSEDSGSETDATSVDSGDVDLMEHLRQALARELGVALSDLTASASLAELGVDSLLALNVMSVVSEIAGQELPATLLADNETLADIEDTLGINGYLVPSKAKSKGCHRRSEGSLPSPNGINICFEDGPQATSVVLQGSPTSAGKMLFLFPDGSGSATSYSAIPAVGSDVVVVGLNCPWMKTPANLKCDFSSYTAHYLPEIRRRQPHGPYHLGGWSAGGICAYEAAQQLSNLDEQVETLILIDSPNPIGLENPPARMFDFFQSLGLFGTGGRAPPAWLRPHFDAFIRMLDDYRIETFAGECPSIHIIYAKDGICKNPDDPKPEIRPDDPREMLWLLNNREDFSARGWKDLVSKDRLFIEVMHEVNHFSMVTQMPQVKRLASFIAASLATG